MDAHAFHRLGIYVLDVCPDDSRAMQEACQFRKSFGAYPLTVLHLWNRIEKKPGLKPIHLLWGLFFLRVYPMEDVLKTILKMDPNTAQKWIWIAVVCIAEADFVSTQ